jgi:hypothetical protein
MKLTEITTVEEQERVDELVGAIGRGIGKAVGGVAKGIGAVAGGIAGIPGAIKKGFKAGKSTVAGDDAEAPAAKEPKQGMFSKMQSDLKTGFQKGQAAAKGQDTSDTDDTGSTAPPPQTTATPQPAAQSAAAPQPAATPQPAAQTTATPKPAAAAEQPAAAEKPTQADTSLMKQLSDRVNALGLDSQRNIAKYLKGIVDNREKQAAKRAPAAKPAATTEPAASTQPAADAAAEKPADAAAQNQPAGGADEKPAGGSLSPGAFGKMAGDLAGGAQKASAEKAGTTKPAASDTAGGKLTPQQQAAKKAELKSRRASGTSTATATGKGFSNYTKSASSQRIVGANPDGSPKIQQIKASREFKQKALRESFKPLTFKIFREQ